MKIKHLLTTFLFLSIFAFATISAWLYSRIDSALPKLIGKATLFGLSTTVKVNRDANGVPTIIAKNRNDAAMALGFIHAQERFFQMDLLRRNAAGELSSLFGRIALDYDKKIRLHRFRDRARAIVKSLNDHEFALLKAYTRGVNQGLDYLKVSPFEYLLLRQPPVAWQEEDSILSVFSMYLDLQHADGAREISLGILNQYLPADIYSFLTPKGSQWDAAIDHSQYPSSPLPTSTWPHVIKENNAKKHIKPIAQASAIEQHFYGSNNWAVTSELSITGHAIVANDMHLGIRVPNTWFRASIEYANKHNHTKVTGVTLPGTPNIVVGSNGNIAWGFTNSYGDWSDVIQLTTNDDNTQYLTPTGYVPFESRTQMIAIKDDESVEISIKETIWGPVIGESANGELLAYRWVAHDLNAINLTQIELETAQHVDQAIDIAAKAGIPAQNIMLADKAGNIAWTIMGPIPIKKGNVGELPTDWSTGENRWLGYLPADQYPKVKNPVTNRLWTANSRVIGGEGYKKIGNGGYALGARAQQIQYRLNQKQQFSEQDLLNIALDTEARFLTRWQQFLINNVLSDSAITQHNWQQAAQIAKQTPLAATTDSVAYRLVRAFRENVKIAVFHPLANYLTSKDSQFKLSTIRHQLEIPLWILINEQPDNVLSKNALTDSKNWQQLFVNAFNKAVTEMTKDQPLTQATWGKKNKAAINHPLSDAIPFLGQLLNMPVDELPGDSYMPRVDGENFGASERMIVSPGQEETGIFHMPTSQAGHPWSPYFGNGHNDWVTGKPTPFLPSETKYQLTLLSY